MNWVKFVIMAIPAQFYDPITFQPQYSPLCFVVQLPASLLKHIRIRRDEYGFHYGGFNKDNIPPMYRLKAAAMKLSEQFPRDFHKIGYPTMVGEMMDYGNSILQANQMVQYKYTIKEFSFNESGEKESYWFQTVVTVYAKHDSYVIMRRNMGNLYFQWKGDLTLDDNGNLESVELTDLALCMGKLNVGL